jgi:hypothetical protein
MRELPMGGKYVFGDAPLSNEWMLAAYLILPLIVGLISGGAFVYLIRRLGWPPSVISMFPISIMFGVLSYVVVAIAVVVPKLVASDYSVHSFIFATTIALFFTWPIALVMAPIFLIYIWFLSKGRKVFRDSTVFYMTVLCLVSELAFVALFFGNPSW